MTVLIGKLIIWLIVGAIAGTMAGRLATFSKQGFGYWTNFGLGMLGAVVGGLIFRILHIDFGWGELKITFEDLMAAFIGSLLVVFAWRFIRKRTQKPAASTAAPAGSARKDDNPFTQ